MKLRARRKRGTQSQMEGLKEKEKEKNNDFFQSKKTGGKKANSCNEEFKFLSEAECRDLFTESMKNDREHQEMIQNLEESCKRNLKDWNLYLRNGFNLLVHGLGSKEQLLTDFCATCLSDLPQIVVLGYLPTLRPKSIMRNILSEIYKLKTIPARLDLQIQAIKKKPIEFVLLIHNIDGVALRTSEAQTLISSLAALDNVHLVASLDHIRAEIQWDEEMLSDLDWVSMVANTMVPYTEETRYTKIFTSSKSTKSQKRAVKHVLASQTIKQRKCLRVLAQEMLSDEQVFRSGISLEDFTAVCCEHMIAFSSQSVRLLLHDFEEHDLVQYTRNPNGVIMCRIPCSREILETEILKDSE